MFTGIVRELGEVLAPPPRLRVQAPRTAGDVAIGDSVSISGVCLTVVEVADGRLAFDVVDETLARSALGRVGAGASVNVEPALRAGDPLGGHYVQGHVDGVGRVRAAEPEGDGIRLWIDAPADVLRYCVDKGSIAVAGVSLTVAGLDEQGFALALIPHTLAETTLGSLRPGDEVNLEADVLAKYVERLLPPR
jgi:riboflavin synthase